MVPERSLRSLLRKHSLRRWFTALSRKKVLKSIAQSSIFHFMRRCMHSVQKNIVVFANKTLLNILLVGLNIYLTIGEHTTHTTHILLHTYMENIQKSIKCTRKKYRTNTYWYSIQVLHKATTRTHHVFTSKINKLSTGKHKKERTKMHRAQH